MARVWAVFVFAELKRMKICKSPKIRELKKEHTQPEVKKCSEEGVFSVFKEEQGAGDTHGFLGQGTQEKVVENQIKEVTGREVRSYMV